MYIKNLVKNRPKFAVPEGNQVEEDEMRNLNSYKNFEKAHDQKFFKMSRQQLEALYQMDTERQMREGEL